MTERVLVTGAAGFVGSHVARALLDAGHAVTGLDSFDPAYGRDQKAAALASLAGRSGWRFIEGDVREAATCAGALAGVLAVVHAAARAGVRTSMAEAAAVGRANVGATGGVLAGMRRAGVRRIVYLSSSSVYGAARPPFHEDTPGRAASPYAASKRAAELLVGVAARQGLRAVRLRLFSVYGPGQRPDQAAMRFASRLAAGQRAVQYGDGSAVRDFTYVGDVASAVVRAVSWTRDNDGMLTVNVAAGRSVPVAEFRRGVARALGVADAVEAAPPAPGDVPATGADTRRARDVLGWTATTRLEDGLAAFAHWFEVTHGRSAGTTAGSGA